MAPQSSGYVGPLDLVPGAVVAYGVRALSAAMLGQNIFRLRRDSDNAESNFAADAVTGEAPVASIATFLGAATGYLVTWYDQSGNAKEFTQATAGLQPLYVANLEGGKPGFKHNASDESALVCAENIAYSGSGYSSLMVAGVGGTGAGRGVYVYFEKTDPQTQFKSEFNGVGAESLGVTITAESNTKVVSEFLSDDVPLDIVVIDYGVFFGGGTLYINNTAKALVNYDVGSSPSAFSADASGMTLGAAGACEILFYDTTKNAATREPGRTNQMSYYGIS